MKDKLQVLNGSKIVEELEDSIDGLIAGIEKQHDEPRPECEDQLSCKKDAVITGFERKFIKDTIRNFEMELMMLLDEAVFQNTQIDSDFETSDEDEPMCEP